MCEYLDKKIAFLAKDPAPASSPRVAIIKNQKVGAVKTEDTPVHL